MSFVPVLSGAVLPLRLQLGDGATNLFPQAHVYDQITLSEVAGSPFALTHDTGGLYNADVSSLADGKYLAIYRVFSDNAHTTQSGLYPNRVTDNYWIAPANAVASTALSNVQWTNARAANLDNLDATVSSRAPSSTALSTAQWTNGRAANLDNLDTTVSSRAPSSTALSTAQWTNGRASNLDNLDTTVSSRQSAATALSQFNTLGSEIVAIPTNPLLTTDSRLNTLDANISSRAPAATALSTAQWTNSRAASLDFLDVAISTRLASASYVAPDNTDILAIKAKTDNLPADPASNTQVNTRASQTSVNAIPTNPLLTNDARLNDLDAAISSRAPASTAVSNADYTTARAVKLDHLDVDVSTRLASASYTAPDNADIVAIKVKTDNLPADPASNTQVNTRVSTTHFDSVLGTPVSSVSADIAAVKAETDGISAIPTNPLLTNDSRLNDLDATISSRQPTATALSQYNSLISALGSIQNNTNFSGIVPAALEIPLSGTVNYTFYAAIFNSSGTPIDPDSDILNFTVKDSQNNILQAATAMTRVGVGQYTGTFPVHSTDTDKDVVVFFNYSIASVAFEQIRTSVITNTANDSENILAIKAKTDNLPSDPASNTNVNTRLLTSHFDSVIGTPAGASVSADIAEIESGVDGIAATAASLAATETALGITEALLTTTASELMTVETDLSTTAADLALTESRLANQVMRPSVTGTINNPQIQGSVNGPVTIFGTVENEEEVE